MSLPVKGDIVINPNTQRPVKVGSRTWLNLVKKGIFKGEYQPKRVIKTDIIPPQAIQKISEENNAVPVKIKKSKSKSKARKSAQIASRVINNNIEELSNADNLSETLEQLILREIEGGYEGDNEYTDEELENLPKLKLVRQSNNSKPQEYYESESESESEVEEETNIEYY